MTGYTTDDLLEIAGVSPGKRREARAELEALLTRERQGRRPPPAPSDDEVTRLVAAIADTLTRPFADSATRKYHPDEEKRCGYAADVIDDLLDPPAAPKPRGRGRPKGALEAAKRRKQNVVDRAVAFWITHSPLALSAAPEGRTYAFVAAVHEVAFERDAVFGANRDRCENVERPFERAVRPWIEEAKARGQKPPGK